jgi:hypothetical protein
MRLIATLLIGWMTAFAWAGLGPLPGLPVIPDNSEVRILRNELQSVLASGTVRNRTLTMWVTGARLPAQERVRVWVGVPAAGASDLKSFVGIVSADGTDVLLEVGKERVSFAQVIREVYGIKIEMKEKK